MRVVLPRKLLSIAPLLLLLLPPSSSFCAPQQHSSRIESSIPIPILYESARILAINKPTGIPHHDENNSNKDNNEPGILSVIRQQQSNGAIEYSGRLYGVHRLDRVTSGILLLAKDKEMASILAKAFQNGNVTKYYTGMSAKKRPANKKQGWVKGSMVRGRRKSWYLTRQTQTDKNNYAVTRYFTAGLAGLTPNGNNNNNNNSLIDESSHVLPKTLILFRPLTGRTHQLRVAAKSLGLPLQGDPIYSDGEGTATTVITHGNTRTYLHATGLHVDLEHEESVTIWSPPPFGHLWTNDGGGFNMALGQLVEKHCIDCDPLLRLALSDLEIKYRQCHKNISRIHL